MRSALFPDPRFSPIHVGEQMIGLHGSNHAEAREFIELGHVGDLRMFYAKAEATLRRLTAPLYCLLRVAKRIQRQLHAAVADSVEAKLEARQRAICRHGIELVRLVLRQ